MFGTKPRFPQTLFIAHHLVKVFGAGVGVIHGKLREHGARLAREPLHRLDRAYSIRFETADDRTQDQNPAVLDRLDGLYHPLPHRIPLLAGAL